MTSAKMIGVRIARNHAVEAHTDPCLMIPEATGPALPRAALVPLHGFVALAEDQPAPSVPRRFGPPLVPYTSDAASRLLTARRAPSRYRIPHDVALVAANVRCLPGDCGWPYGARGEPPAISSYRRA